MLFGNGIELGIGIAAHPDINNDIDIMAAKIIAFFMLFSNLEVSPLDLYYFAHYKGF